MEKFWEFLVGVATGKKSKVFWAAVIVIALIGVVIFPYIDANFLYYNRIEKRIANLQNLVELTEKPLEESPELNEEYISILEEIAVAREKSLATATRAEDSKHDRLVKFAGGAGLWAIVAIAVLFARKKGEKMSFKKVLNNLLSSLVCVAFGSFVGLFFTWIPTLGAVEVNAVLAPIIQLVVVWLIIESSNKRKSSSTTAV